MTSGAIVHGKDVPADLDLECDVCIVGSGAGGAVLAAGLAEQGLRVIVLESGGHFTKADFNGQEGWAYPALYQDRGTRATADLGIAILQGHNVGGGTTVNWTTCFRTPQRILDHWGEHRGLRTWDAATLAPHFAAIEQRLHIEEWPETSANANNRVLLDGCRKLGWEVAPLRRNVRYCGNTGMCGLGCPLDAKQAMAITYLADAVQAGATVHADCPVRRLVRDGARITAVEAEIVERDTGRPRGPKVRVRAKVVSVSGGAINSPALLLRSGITEGPVGRRTFLHPVVALPALYDHRIDGFFGAPQSIGSHHFIDRGPDEVGFFLEVPPLQPMLVASASPAFGPTQQELMSRLPHLGVLIAIHVDGLLPGDEGGAVTVKSDGRAAVDYPIRPALARAFRAAHEAMGAIAFAAGAKEVVSTHRDPLRLASADALAQLADRPYGALEHSIFSAHQMGGCAMGPDPATSVVDEQLRHHHVRNLFVVDGSVLPTALGVNPSETIYALAHRARDFVAAALG
jgi:choline dehydrogenase-like flavoprotein